jgi:hypothetical protein
MRDVSGIRPIFDTSEEPIRRGSSEDNIRLDLKGNFHRIVEVVSDVAARLNARRGK